MTDWRGLASALVVNFPEADLERIAPLLQTLESAFAALAATLDYTTEPVTILSTRAVCAPNPDE